MAKATHLITITLCVIGMPPDNIARTRISIRTKIDTYTIFGENRARATYHIVIEIDICDVLLYDVCIIACIRFF